MIEAATPAVTPPGVEPGTISVVPAELGLLTVETLYLATHSSFVPDVDDQVVLATLMVGYTDGGPPTTLDFVTGSTTAEWSYDRPEHTSAFGGVQHAQALVLYSFETTIDSAFTYNGFSYSVVLPVDSFRTISSLTLSVTDPATYATSRLETGPLAGWAGQAITAITLVGQALVIAEEKACCFDDGSCADLERDDCIAVLGTAQGEGTDCATTDCPGESAEPEACCVPPLPGFELVGESFQQSCSNIGTPPYETRDDCRFFGAVPQGPGTTCANTVCDEDFRACCFPPPQASCSELLFEDCLDAGGDPQGSDVHCDNFPCGDATEACCFPDGQCSDTDPDTCQANGGAPDGPGSACLSSCLGACCKPEGICDEMTLAQCDMARGEYEGLGVSCASVTCVALGGCCFNDTLFCFGDIRADACQNAGGTPLPDCEPDTLDPCQFACCRADGTCTEGLTVDECNAANDTVNARGTTCDDVTCAPAVPGMPTIAVCPAGFVANLGVFQEQLVDVVLDSFSPDVETSVANGAGCNYVRQDGGGAGPALVTFFGPEQNFGCGQPGEIVPLAENFFSTQRTIFVATSGGTTPIVDSEGVAAEFIGNLVSAGVGLACVLTEPPALTCNDVIGSRNWVAPPDNNAFFGLTQDGSAIPTDSPFVAQGTWTCVNDPAPTIRIAWGSLNGGDLVTDTLTLSSDDNTLSGPNNLGFQVRATRR